MSSVGGPGGIGGPKGPDGPDRPEDVGDVVAESAVESAAPSPEIDAIAAELAAGRLTPHEAIDKLVDQIAGTDQLEPAERAELREMLADLVANDPYLAALVGRV